MITLGRFHGLNGEIEVVEFLRDGSRAYFEAGVWQTLASRDGCSVFTYVKIMEVLLLPATNILLLGCGGGTLATSLAKQGKRVTVVDNNPISFGIAERFFGLPKSITCIASDFRSYLDKSCESYDAIGIDLGGPGFTLSSVFDESICAMIQSRLTADGRIIMNALLSHRFDIRANRIARRFLRHSLNCWVLDGPGLLQRNAVIACVPEIESPSNGPVAQLIYNSEEKWRTRKL